MQINNFTVTYDISTHAPRAGSDRIDVRHKARRHLISTHAPRAGSDVG